VILLCGVPEPSTQIAGIGVDNGTGKIRGIYTQGDSAVDSIFKQWIAPLRDLGVTTTTNRNTGGCSPLRQIDGMADRHAKKGPPDGFGATETGPLRAPAALFRGTVLALDICGVRMRAIVARYLYGDDGSTIGYMDSNDKYLYSSGGAAIAYWDSKHKYMYTPTGETFGYIDSRGRYLYSQSGETVGYFHPPYESV